MCKKISIIIPTLNEEENIYRLLEYLQKNFPGVEIIVADGGSEDRTVGIASKHAIILHTEKGRAVQMNAGAGTASGDIFWFLHADCVPSPRSVELIIEACSNDRIAGGGFRWKLDGSKWYYGIVTRTAHIKNKLKRSLFGDMGIFVKADIFRKLNGFLEIPMMEEVEFNRRLRKIGKTVLFNEPIISSDRRLMKNGPMKSFIINDIIKIAYWLGFSPEFLKKFYK
jgi:rSAM/selenodomain-associated transferase 2